MTERRSPVATSQSPVVTHAEVAAGTGASQPLVLVFSETRPRRHKRLWFAAPRYQRLCTDGAMYDR